MPLSPELQEAVDTAKAGQRAEARSMLKQILRNDPTNEAAWFIYAQIADNREHAIFCLKKVMEYNPYNERARQMLAKLLPEDILEKTASHKEWDYNKYIEKQGKAQGGGQKKSGIKQKGCHRDRWRARYRGDDGSRILFCPQAVPAQADHCPPARLPASR